MMHLQMLHLWICLQMLQHLWTCLLIGLLVWLLLAMLLQLFVVTTILKWTQQCIYYDADCPGAVPEKWLYHQTWILIHAVCHPFIPHLPSFSFLPLLGLAAWIGHCHVAPGWLVAPLEFAFLHVFLQAAQHFRKVLLHLLPRWCYELEAFSARKTAPVVADDNVIEKCVVILHVTYAQMGQQDTWFFGPSFTSSSMWIGMCNSVKHEWSSCRSPNGVTVPPSKTMIVRGCPSSFTNSNKHLTLRALAADFGPMTTLDFCELVQ